MSSLIILSSSPVRTFARSPTPVDIPSPPKLPQSGTDYDPWSVATKPYRPSCTRRDCFSPSYTTTKQALSQRNSAENVPIAILSPPKFKSTTPRIASILPPRCARGLPSNTAERVPATIFDPLPPDEADPRSATAVVDIVPGNAEIKRSSTKIGTPDVEKAAAAGRDPTPDRSHRTDSDLADRSCHKDASVPFVKLMGAEEGNLVKRRKLATANGPSDASAMRPLVQTTNMSARKTSSIRTKSPTRKSLTITGLATSNYADDSRDEATPMLQYLVSTQARAGADDSFDTFETKVKKSSKQTKAKHKSRLKSPRTAMKTVESQDVIFATASQITRDESPSLIRDTAEAMKLSEQNPFSSPLHTQQTAIFSVESTTPEKAGTLRYRSRNGLWSAADRDENDAIFHADDEVEASLCAGDPFVGDDPLLDAGAADPDLGEIDDSMALLAALKPGQALSSPAPGAFRAMPPVTSAVKNPVQARHYSTGTALSISKRKKTLEGPQLDSASLAVQGLDQPSYSDGLQKKSTPPMPNYALWADEELKDACKAHGFKRLRARKSMIEKLCECFAEEHGLIVANVKAAQKRAEQAAKNPPAEDVLGRVHDLAARPLAKPKKKRKKKTETKGIVVESRHWPDEVIDVSDLENSCLNTWDRLAAIKVPSDDPRDNEELIDDDEPDQLEEIEYIDDLPPSTAPVRGTGVRAITARAKIKDEDKYWQGPPTPPPTGPVPTQTQLSSPGFEELKHLPNVSPRPPSISVRAISLLDFPASPDPTNPCIIESLSSLSTSNVPDDVPLASRILEAVKTPPPENDTRNHYKTPTWYEKILMYDPIVLEDLTVWLNTEGFNAIGEDREINTCEVRDWCHANGVCCLWKGGWRGNKRSRKEVVSEGEEPSVRA